jgi:hypothetical protein
MSGLSHGSFKSLGVFSADDWSVLSFNVQKNQKNATNDSMRQRHHAVLGISDSEINRSV